MSRALLALLAGGSAVMLSGVAHACPSCGVGRPASGPGSALVLGAMLLLPFLVVLAVVVVVRRLATPDRPDGAAPRRAPPAVAPRLTAWLAPLLVAAAVLHGPAVQAADPAPVAATAFGPRNVNLPSPVAGRGLWLPPDASVDGWRIDRLITTTTAFVVVLFAVVVLFMGYVLLVHRGRRPARYEHQSRVGLLIVAGCVLLMALEDGQLFIRSVLDLREVFWNFASAEEKPGVVRIQVNARQWAWEARYPGKDGRFNTPDDIVVLNHLRVPVGATVIFQLASTDVIHGFSLPNFRVKQDAVPGLITRLRLATRTTGDFAIACQQHCGVGHYKMRGILSVLPREAYDAWVERASEVALRAYEPADLPAHWGWEWKRP